MIRKNIEKINMLTIPEEYQKLQDVQDHTMTAQGTILSTALKFIIREFFTLIKLVIFMIFLLR